MSRVLKVMTYDVKALHMAFVDTVGTMFLISLENSEKFIAKSSL